MTTRAPLTCGPLPGWCTGDVDDLLSDRINRSFVAGCRAAAGGARFSPKSGTAIRPDRRPACLNGVVRSGRMRDRPYEAERLACHRRDRHDAELAAREEPAVAAAQPMTCLLGDGAYRGQLALSTAGG